MYLCNRLLTHGKWISKCPTDRREDELFCPQFYTMEGHLSIYMQMASKSQPATPAASLLSSFQLPNSLCGRKSGRAQKWPHLRGGILYCTRSNINNSPLSLSLSLSLSPSHLPSIPHPELPITYVNLMSLCTPRKSDRVLDRISIRHENYVT